MQCKTLLTNISAAFMKETHLCACVALFVGALIAVMVRNN
jgi:hypothetical protein